MNLPARAWPVIRKVAFDTFDEGFIHAGNLAYLALMTLFPFFIVAAAVLSLVGQSTETQRAVTSFLSVLPPESAELLRKPIADVRKRLEQLARAEGYSIGELFGARSGTAPATAGPRRPGVLTCR